MFEPNLDAQFFVYVIFNILQKVELYSLQKVELVPIFYSFMDCEVDLDGTNNNDIELGSIATTRNVRPHITPPRRFSYGETIVQLVSNALFSS